jgi:hypothetical protein
MAHWGKIFQKGFEKFRKRIVRLSAGQCKEDGERNPEFRISMHCSTLGQNFSIFKKLEKFIQHYILGQIFPFLSEENWKNSKSHLNGPREGVSPKIC